MTIFFAESFHDLYLFHFKGLKNVALVGSVVRRSSKDSLNPIPSFSSPSKLSQMALSTGWPETKLIFQCPDGMD